MFPTQIWITSLIREAYAIFLPMKGHCHPCSVLPRGGEGAGLRKRGKGTAQKSSRKMRYFFIVATSALEAHKVTARQRGSG